ncbi:MAG: class I SAM-dependent methyltransferase [bacterium]
MRNFAKKHWNGVYSSRDTETLGWYEQIPSHSIKLLSKIKIRKNEPVVDVGAGASTLIDYLLEEGFSNIIACDISEIALSKLKERLGKENSSQISWVIDDVTRPQHLQNLKNVALWHDRALLHFLLEGEQQKMYLSTLKTILKRGGYVIIAAFSLKGARKCSGLDIKNYDQKMLAQFLGEEFKLIEYFDCTYHMPSGDPRPYVYTLFQRAFA